MEECIQSVLSQEATKSDVYIATSTPSEWIDNVARAYDLPVFVNQGEHGIGPDWCFAYEQASTPLVTIAHQDDVYCAGYAADAIARMDKMPNSLIYFCNYGELRGNKAVTGGLNLRIKRALLLPLRSKRASYTKAAKRFPIAFGNAICCPAVCYNKELLPTVPFNTSMRNALDWDCWERLSQQDGAFCYSPYVGMYHRIHEESATSENIQDNTRSSEDLQMLQRFWPRPIANFINRFYAHGMDSNAL